MGTLFKYIFYIILVVLIYVIGKDIYDGKINEDTSVLQVSSDAANGTKSTIENGIKKLEEEVSSIKIESTKKAE
ncbi:MAG: hypothetical protein J6K16_05500 [Alphaproteobacteria bacterium]|nr:hypothetical protein [Alphaproteobacteria bacterium]